MNQRRTLEESLASCRKQVVTAAAAAASAATAAAEAAKNRKKPKATKNMPIRAFENHFLIIQQYLFNIKTPQKFSLFEYFYRKRIYYIASLTGVMLDLSHDIVPLNSDIIPCMLK